MDDNNRTRFVGQQQHQQGHSLLYRDDFHSRPSSSSASSSAGVGGPPHPEDQPSMPSRQSLEVSSSSSSSFFPPHVTISNAGGSVVQYHPFPDCCVLEEHEGQRRSSVAPPSSGSSSRSWRSHSLTPTTPSNSVSEAEWAIQKARSNSLTFGAKDHQHGRSGPVLNASTGVVGSSSELDAGGGGSGAIEEIIGRLPEGSGMRELQDWLKSLRLHKYTKLLLEFNYEELLTLDDKKLEAKNVTLGARGKILKEVSLIKERREKLSEMKTVLEDLTDMGKLEKMLPDLEKIILMPLKPYQQSAIGTRRRLSSAAGNLDPYHQHQLASSAGGLTSDHHPFPSSQLQQENLPEEIFEVLKRVCSCILLSEAFHHGVVTVYVCLLERCLHREAFTNQQKQLFSAWIHRLRSVWNPPSIRKSTDYKRKSSRELTTSCLMARRQSVGGISCGVGGGRALPPPPPGLGSAGCCPFGPRGPSPMSLKQQQPPISTPSGGAGFSSHEVRPLHYPSSLQRRSVPEINPPIYPQIKRNSYQGDHRMVPLIDSEILSNLMDSGMGQTTSSGISGGINSTVGTQCPSSSSSRRESTMSCDSGYYLSLPSSRRASSLSDPISRRDSTMSECENMSSFILPHDGGCGGGGVGGSGGGVNISCIGPITTTSCVGPGSTAISRRDSSMSNDSGSSSFLSVESARQPGSVSSGCPSDGSTDSLVEQDLRNLSLSVTEKLWNE